MTKKNDKKVSALCVAVALAFLLGVCCALDNHHMVASPVLFEEEVGEAASVQERSTPEFEEPVFFDEPPFTFYNGTYAVVPEEHFHHHIAARASNQLDIQLSFQDVISGSSTNFNHPSLGAPRRACVIQAFAYYNSILNVNPANANKRWNVLVTSGTSVSFSGGFSGYDSAEFSRSYAERVIIDGELVGGSASTLHSTITINFANSFTLPTCSSSEGLRTLPLPTGNQFDYIRAILRAINGALGVKSNINYAANNCAGANPSQSAALHTVVGTCSPAVNWATSFDKNVGTRAGTSYFSGAPSDDTYTGPDNAPFSNNAGYLGANAKAANGNSPVALYSATPYTSSIAMSFLDNKCLESNYLQCVMKASPFTREGRRTNTPFELGILKDLGYSFVSYNNDECPNATPITLGTTTFSTAGMTSSPAAPASCPGLSNDLWFSYQTFEDGTFIFETCQSAFDAAIVIYDTCSFGSDIAQTCNSNGCGINRGSRTIPMYKGQIAYIRIGSITGAAGAGVLKVTKANQRCDANPNRIMTVFPPGSVLSNTARNLLMNRISPCSSSFTITTIDYELYYNSANSFQNGDAYSLFVWQDLDGDGNPKTGTLTLLYSANLVMSGVSTALVTYNHVPTSTITVTGGGDIYLGFIGYHSRGALYSLLINPETTASYRSYVGQPNNNAFSAGDPFPQLQSLRNVDTALDYFRFDLSMTTTDITPAPTPVVSVNSFPLNIPENISPASFVIARTGASATTLAVTFTIGGTATYGTHYSTSISGGQAGSNTITLAVGENARTITVTPIPDATNQIDRTVTMTIATDPAYIIGASPATVTISNVDAISVTLDVSSLAENSGSPATFTITRASLTFNSLTVYFNVAGTATISTDYSTTFTGSGANSVTFAAGETTKTFTVTPLTDALTAESTETVIVSITTDATYILGTSTQTLSITNVIPTISVSLDVSSLAENSGSAATFTITRSVLTSYSTTVLFSVAGTATISTDYSTTFTGSGANSVTFAAGQTTKTFTVTPLTDALTTESTETVIVSITTDATYTTGSPSTQTLSITNIIPTISVSLDVSTLAENSGSAATFTITRSVLTSYSTTVLFSVAGTATISTDYSTTFTGSGANSVTFAAGQTTKTFTVTPSPDNLVEADETVIVSITTDATYTTGSPSIQTLTITESTPVISVSLNPVTLQEGGGSATFTISRTGPSASALNVKIDVAGTATFATDYSSSLTGYGANTVTIPSGMSQLLINVYPSVDTLFSEPTETVIISISSGTVYAVGSPSTQTLSITNRASDLNVECRSSLSAELRAPTWSYTATPNMVLSALSCSIPIETVSLSKSVFTLRDTATISTPVTVTAVDSVGTHATCGSSVYPVLSGTLITNSLSSLLSVPRGTSFTVTWATSASSFSSADKVTVMLQTLVNTNAATVCTNIDYNVGQCSFVFPVSLSTITTYKLKITINSTINGGSSTVKFF